jgi:hypothetical protein
LNKSGRRRVSVKSTQVFEQLRKKESGVIRTVLEIKTESILHDADQILVRIQFVLLGCLDQIVDGRGNGGRNSKRANFESEGKLYIYQREER